MLLLFRRINRVYSAVTYISVYRKKCKVCFCQRAEFRFLIVVELCRRKGFYAWWKAMEDGKEGLTLERLLLDVHSCARRAEAHEQTARHCPLPGLLLWFLAPIPEAHHFICTYY